MALEIEQEYYVSRKDEFLRTYAGQFLLIKGKELVGAFTTAAQAYEAALKKFGNVPVLIQQAVEEAHEPQANYFALAFGLI